MAIKTLVLDDLDGSEGAETVRFTINARIFEIDLVPSNLAKLEKALMPYMTKGRDLTPAPRPHDPADDVDIAEVRDWAMRQGMDVSPRGRVATHIIHAYLRAQREPQPSTDGDTEGAEPEKDASTAA